MQTSHTIEDDETEFKELSTDNWTHESRRDEDAVLSAHLDLELCVVLTFCKADCPIPLTNL